MVIFVELIVLVVVVENVLQWEVKLSFVIIVLLFGSIVLCGLWFDVLVEFGMCSDELVVNVLFNLEYILLFLLLFVQLQLKVYFNDELMGVLFVIKEQLGKKICVQLLIDLLYIIDFNCVWLEFVGYYCDVCENLVSSMLWLDVGCESYLDFIYQLLKVNNDLLYFLVLFYDLCDNCLLKLLMIFLGLLVVIQQQVVVIVVFWFGSKVGWCGQQFLVYFNELLDCNVIVFVINDKCLDFLCDYLLVKVLIIEMIDNLNDFYVKLLVIFGCDDNDLLLVVKGIVQGNILFCGSSVIVDGIKILQLCQFYDVLNWVCIDCLVIFVELKIYE